jgi:hypothetical protein
MIRITAPHFVAGVVITCGRVGRRARILDYMIGWTAQQVIAYVEKKHWRYELLP